MLAFNASKNKFLIMDSDKNKMDNLKLNFSLINIRLNITISIGMLLRSLLNMNVSH